MQWQKENIMKVFWEDLQKTIIIRQFPETWTWDDYLLAIHKTHEMLREVSHDVYLIIDARIINSLPRGAMSHLHEANRSVPPNLIMRVLVSDSKLIKAFLEQLKRVTPESYLSFYLVAGMEEAYEKISQAKTRNTWS